MTARQPKRTLVDFPVEKGVPIPVKRAGSFRYPFPAMEVGDSFLTPREQGEDSARNCYRSSRLWGARQSPPPAVLCSPSPRGLALVED